MERHKVWAVRIAEVYRDKGEYSPSEDQDSARHRRLGRRVSDGGRPGATGSASGSSHSARG